MDYKRRRRRRSKASHRSAIQSPQELSFVIRSNGKFAVSRNVATSAITPALRVGSKIISAPVLATGEVHVIGNLTKGSKVTLLSGFSLYIDAGLGKWKKVCGFTPIVADLFALLSKYNGSLWVTGPVYNFVSSDGTVALGNNGSMGYSNDLVGLRPLSQATTSRKPLLKLTSGLWGTKFDGIDDALLSASQPSAVAETFGFVYTAPAIASGQFPLSRRNAGTSVGSAFYLNGTSNAACFINGNNAAVTGAVVSTGSKGVVSVVGKVGNVAVRVNNVDGASVAYASYVSGNGAVVLGNSQDGLRPFAGTCHAAYYVPGEVPNADRLVIDRLLGSLYGLTLP